MKNRLTKKTIAAQARYSIYFIYKMREILKDGENRGEKINDIETFFNELKKSKKFVDTVTSEFGVFDSYSMVAGIWMFDPDSKRYRNLSDLCSTIWESYQVPSLHAFFSIKEWQAHNYFLCAAHAYDALNALEAETKEEWNNRMREMRSKIGKDAALAKHEKTTYKLRDKAIELFEARTYRSAHEASKEIAKDVLAYAREIGVPFSEDQAQKTTYGWILRHKKQKR